MAKRANVRGEAFMSPRKGVRPGPALTGSWRISTIKLGGTMPVSASVTKTVRAVCPHDCPDTCSMVVTVRDGVAVDLRGDAEHSFTRGFLCQKVSRYLERVYHPERLAWPMKRVGPKGKGEFAR